MERAATISLAVDPALLEAARTKGLDLAALLERALIRELDDTGCQSWLHNNERAIRSMNEYVEAHGLLSDRYKVD